ncbi:MAG: hypothetical protein RSG76_01775 [Anaerovoracaceae bacterium]
MKKMISLLLVLIAALSFCNAYVYADGGEITASQDLTGGVVTRFAYERVFASLTLDCYQKGKLDELYDLLDIIDDALDCTVALPDGSTVETACTAEWNTGELTLDTSGLYDVTATLIPPKGCTFGDGVRTQIVVPVQILDAENNTVTIIAMDEFIQDSVSAAIPAGSTPESLATQPDLQDAALTCYDQNGGEHRASILWDDSAVDLQTVGVYRMQGTPQPPVGTTFDEGLVFPEISAAVSVQTPGKPEINCYYRGRGVFRFPWVLTPEQTGTLDAFEAWLCTDGVWEKLEEGYYIGEEYFSIALWRLPQGEPCQLQVIYPGGQTGILTFTYDGTTLDADYSEGDRDGGDSDGEENRDDDSIGGTPSPTPSPEPTPASTPPSAPDPTPPANGGEQNSAGKPSAEQTALAPFDEDETSTFVERSDETSTILSGLRLRMMRKNGGVPFSKQGVNIVLSEKAIDNLPLADDSVFTIEIKRESENKFSFAVSVDSVEITELVDTKITLPYTPNEKEPILSVRHNKLEEETPGSYEAQQRLASFLVNTCGQYTIFEESVPASASPSGSEQSEQPKTEELPILPICLFALLPLCGGIVRLKRRSDK